MPRTSARQLQAFLLLTYKTLLSLIFNCVIVNSISSQITYKKDLIIIGENRAMRMWRALSISIETATLMHNKCRQILRNSLIQMINNNRTTGIIGNSNSIALLVNRNMTRIISMSLNNLDNIIFIINYIESPFASLLNNI